MTVFEFVSSGMKHSSILATAKVPVIVDCEVFCHNPKNHREKAETFTSYKHHNTPDKHLTERGVNHS